MLSNTDIEILFTGYTCSHKVFQFPNYVVSAENIKERVKCTSETLELLSFIRFTLGKSDI